MHVSFAGADSSSHMVVIHVSDYPGRQVVNTIGLTVVKRHCARSFRRMGRHRHPGAGIRRI